MLCVGPVVLTLSDGGQVSVLKDDWQRVDVPVQVSAFHRKWGKRQEVVGALDGGGHLLVAVGAERSRPGVKYYIKYFQIVVDSKAGCPYRGIKE